MKTSLLVMSALCLVQFPLYAQVTVVAPPPAPSGVVVVAPGTVVVRAEDASVFRRQLSTAPKTVVVTETPQSKTTQTTTVVETVGQPGRVYNAERNVVIVEDQGQRRELPYVTLPVLFVKGTAKLLDDESKAALQQVADVILAVRKTEPGSVYDIEGHTSTDGTSEDNMELSAARAKRVYDVLTETYGVPATSLSAHGYGELFPMYPKGNEEELQLDRRVLVVRTK
ncbi:OmpA family protein [Prosthecobacter sp.]|uniref:OmpA family protein n=1 Tax=Prosthecobacter sp. TaxID=1965333 RepID=UPI0024897120|nr:OmpA family protein [Prosthecobacter sp.]MDI1311081.1 OmpA family protein [Prosthecobacter sp.]